MIIKKLELLNFQVIKEFNADFEGNVYFITGDKFQFYLSSIKSLEFLFGFIVLAFEVVKLRCYRR